MLGFCLDLAWICLGVAWILVDFGGGWLFFLHRARLAWVHPMSPLAGADIAIHLFLRTTITTRYARMDVDELDSIELYFVASIDPGLAIYTHIFIYLSSYLSISLSMSYPSHPTVR